MINELIHSLSQLFKLNRILPKVNCAISQCQSRFKCASSYMAQPFQEEEIGELLPKKIVRIAGRKLDGHHVLFGEYLQY